MPAPYSGTWVVLPFLFLMASSGERPEKVLGKRARTPADTPGLPQLFIDHQFLQIKFIMVFRTIVVCGDIIFSDPKLLTLSN